MKLYFSLKKIVYTNITQFPLRDTVLLLIDDQNDSAVMYKNFD